jgi:hypothetical protein
VRLLHFKNAAVNVVRDMEKNHTMAFAAALAYYFVLALFPFLILLSLSLPICRFRGVHLELRHADECCFRCQIIWEWTWDVVGVTFSPKPYIMRSMNSRRRSPSKRAASNSFKSSKAFEIPDGRNAAHRNQSPCGVPRICDRC